MLVLTGAVDRQLLARLERRFVELDKNGDGKLTALDLKKGAETLRREWDEVRAEQSFQQQSLKRRLTRQLTQPTSMGSRERAGTQIRERRPSRGGVPRVDPMVAEDATTTAETPRAAADDESKDDAPDATADEKGYDDEVQTAAEPPRGEGGETHSQDSWL